MGQRDLAKMRTSLMDPRGRGTTQGGWICGIIGTILSTLALLVGGGMAAIFLIQMAMAPTIAPPPPPAPVTQPRGRRIEFDRGLKDAVPFKPAAGAGEIMKNLPLGL
jgi:hypothetical protein